MVSEVEGRLEKAGIKLPKPNPPVANYVPVTRSGDQLFVSGQIPLDAAGKPACGRLGADVTVERGQEYAAQCATAIIAHLRNALDGDLDRVSRVVKLQVFVNSTADFSQQPLVANGASDRMVLAFGDAGRHARSAVGVASLPFGVPVEVDAVVEIRA